jgi:AcrR family transcriptional regulator
LRALPEHGYAGLTIGHLTREAGVSRASFYSQFKSKEACFLATYDIVAEWLCERVEAVAATEEEWAAGVGAAVATAMRLLAANPDIAHLIGVEAPRSHEARKRRRACFAWLAGPLRAGRPAQSELLAELEELLLGGALSLVGRYVEARMTGRLPEATAELVHCLLIPYLELGEPARIAAEAA